MSVADVNLGKTFRCWRKVMSSASSLLHLCSHRMHRMWGSHTHTPFILLRFLINDVIENQWEHGGTCRIQAPPPASLFVWQPTWSCSITFYSAFLCCREKQTYRFVASGLALGIQSVQATSEAACLEWGQLAFPLDTAVFSQECTCPQMTI